MYYTTATDNSLSLEDFTEGDHLEPLLPYHLLIDLRTKNELQFVKFPIRLPDSAVRIDQSLTHSDDDLLFMTRAVIKAFESKIVKDVLMKNANPIAI